MTITSLHGDALDLLPTLEVGSIQALVTSPPYYGLRSYAIPPSSWPAVAYTPLIGLPPVVIPPMVCQLGAEPDPLAYIGHLVHVFRLARPALRKDATLWVNLADSYAGSSMTGGTSSKEGSPSRANRMFEKPKDELIPSKNLCGIPARAALALQADGWVWRNDIIWHATNKMPESVRDRFTRAHEDVLLFGNSARYYFDSEAVAESAVKGDAGAGPRNYRTNGNSNQRQYEGQTDKERTFRNRRDVWSIPTTPMPAHLRNGDEAHYAAWPPALVEVMVNASTANKACGACGAAWVRQVGQVGTVADRWSKTNGLAGHIGGTHTERTTRRVMETTGFAPACACNADPARCVVLDPFAGTGTTLAVAESLGRDSIGIDLGYQTLQARRTDGVQIDMEAFL